MEQRTSHIPRIARLTLAAALLLGITGDWWLQEGMGRLGLALWIVLAVAVAWALRPPLRSAWPDRLVLSAVLIAGAGGFVLRDADALLALNFLAMLFAATLFAWHAHEQRLLRTLRIDEFVTIPLRTGIAAAVGMPHLLAQSRFWPGEKRTSSLSPRTRHLLLGLVIAVPIALIAALLLLSADPVSRALAELPFELPFGEWLTHLLPIAFFTWIAAGWLRGWDAGSYTPQLPANVAAIAPASRVLILTPALYAVAAVLIAFLAIQAGALFGGAEYVESTSGLTYAEYAREGFLGLVLTAGWVLLLLLVGDCWLESTQTREWRRFRQLGWLLLALVAVVLASAGQRIALYIDYYGLTETRVYATAVTILAALALAWCSATVLRGKRVWFPVGLLGLGFATVFALYLINPERVVVQVNAARVLQGEEFDVEYHAQLSADAIPSLLQAAESLPMEQCVALVTALHAKWNESPTHSSPQAWQAWNLPRARVQTMLGEDVQAMIERHCLLQ